MNDFTDSIDEIDDFMKGENKNTSIEQLLDKFVVLDENLILKTDIENSKAFTALKVLISELKKKKLKQSSKTLSNFCDWYVKVRVSHGRLSRKEILDAISAIRKENSTSTIGARLLNIGRDKNVSQ